MATLYKANPLAAIYMHTAGGKGFFFFFFFKLLWIDTLCIMADNS